MGKKIGRDAICRIHCTYYKPGRKEALECGAFGLLLRNLSRGELRRAAGNRALRPDFSRDREIRKLACARCEFLRGGCGFREDRVSPPCGGYSIVEGLLKKCSPA